MIHVTTITVRIPEDLKRRMNRLKGVNWSDVVREALLETIIIQEKMRERDWDLVKKAAREADELRIRLEARHGRCNYDSAETIRYWRDIRAWKE